MTETTRTIYCYKDNFGKVATVISDGGGWGMVTLTVWEGEAWGKRCNFIPEDAREVAKALLAAADEVEKY